MTFDEELLKKREDLLSRGIDPYPYAWDRTHTLRELREARDELVDREDIQERIAGRLVAYRGKGKMVFVDLEDLDGRLQVMLRKNEFDEATWDLVRHHFDLGDWLGVEGHLFVTKMGELTVHAKQLVLLAKSVVRVPIIKTKASSELSPEVRYRQRYLHWITDPDARELVRRRARTIAAIRRWLDEEGFIEVSTPTIEMTYGGAEARPFRTRIHALSDQTAYLRISPELSLKRFIVGGFDRVYTICQNFRNEGIDRSHNPEFTMLEWYEAFTDYERQMRRFEQLVAYVAEAVTGAPQVPWGDVTLDFTPPWGRLSVLEGLRDAGVDADAMDENELRHEFERRGLPRPQPFTWGHAVAELFERLVEPHIQQPTFVCDHPVDVSPLTKKKRGDDRLVERFEPLVGGMELGNAYSELTDPVEQLERFRRQRELGADREGVEHHPIDEDFVHAVACGMPPTGGVGLGVDRLVMLLTGSRTIRDVIPFPLMRSHAEAGPGEDRGGEEEPEEGAGSPAEAGG